MNTLILQIIFIKKMKNFFRDRLLELLHKDTLDSYRVKVNNSNSLLYELHQLLNDWKAGKINNLKRYKFPVKNYWIH